ncbi:MAG: N-acetylmuramoyl-L-alanine amidase [Acidobacteria bacterium]|nr:MAG: N-acetylmuramoyl-L-alanine amidase [Acidobacteriota bacterium]
MHTENACQTSDEPKTGDWRLTTGDWRLTTGDWRLVTDD